MVPLLLLILVLLRLKPISTFVRSTSNLLVLRSEDQLNNANRFSIKQQRVCTWVHSRQNKLMECIKCLDEEGDEKDMKMTLSGVTALLMIGKAKTATCIDQERCVSLRNIPDNVCEYEKALMEGHGFGPNKRPILNTDPNKGGFYEDMFHSIAQSGRQLAFAPAKRHL